MNVRKVVVASAVVGLVGFSAQALVVDQDMTITAAPEGGVQFAGNHTLTVEGSFFLGKVVNDGHQATLRLNDGNVNVSWIEGKNGSYTRIEFNGGALADGGGWGTAWFMPDATSTFELASVNGKAISIRHPTSQWKYLVDGKGRVFTSGEGRFEVATAGVHNGTTLYCVLNTSRTNYLHTGGTLLQGNNIYTVGQIRLNDGNALPPGEIQLGDVSGLKCILHIHATQQDAYRIIGYPGSAITNATASATSLNFTQNDSCLDAVLAGHSYNVVMNGSSDSDVFTLKTPNVSGQFSVVKGKAVVQSPRGGGGTHCGQLRVCAGTTLEIDGVALTTGRFSNEGGEVICKNGGTLTVDQTVASGSTLFDTDGLHADGWTSFVKSGAGTLYLSGHNLLAVPECRVAGGTMRFAGPLETTNHWWRFTARQSATAGGPLSIGPVRLLDIDCNFADGANDPSRGGNYSAVGASVSPTAYQPKQYYCSSADYYKGAKTGSDNPVGPNAIFNSSSVYDCTFISPKPKESDPSTWITWTYRIANANVAIRGYNLKTQWGAINNWPRSWKIESSPSGADGTWQLMDERSGYTAIINGQQWYNDGGYGVGGNDGHPSTKITFDSLDVSTVPTRGGLAAGSAVRVDRGATFDCSQCGAQQELSALTVDCAAGTGVGTLKNVKLAATGVIRLLNATGKSGVTLPLAFVDSVTTGLLEGWTVYVNGVEASKLALAWQDGQLVIPRVGMAVLLK